jgi:hypothetical protein
LPAGAFRAKALWLMLVRPILLALGLSLVAASAHAQVPEPKHYGEVAVSAVERFGYLAINNAPVGKSGIVRGAGIELRFMMPIGWGAYYRYTSVATANKDRFDWFSGEFVAGLSKRLLAIGRRDLWSPRVSARFDFGVGWTQTGTNESCTRSFVPFGTKCSTGPNRPMNVQGDALVVEARFGADFLVGPINVGLDVGSAAYMNITTGENSQSLPAFFFSPSGQLKLGVGLPF